VFGCEGVVEVEIALGSNAVVLGVGPIVVSVALLALEGVVIDVIVVSVITVVVVVVGGCVVVATVAATVVVGG